MSAATWLRPILSYGFFQVLPLQFPEPGPDRLIMSYGDSSPMGLLWRFMGASRPYTVFGGLAEALGGLLLLWRRTTLLGALVAFGLLLNIVMLNFSYDVPVKLFSSLLLGLALFLVWPDVGRLVDLFVRNRPGAADLAALPDPAAVATTHRSAREGPDRRFDRRWALWANYSNWARPRPLGAAAPAP